MKTAVINFKTDSATKALARKRAEQLGVSVSFLAEQALRDILELDAVPLKPLIPTKETAKAIKEAQRERKNGKAPKLVTSDEFIKHLRSL